jgi:CheY-like chemotaxis protein
MPARDRRKIVSSPLILIVENDPGNRKLAELILLQEHFQTRAVAGGADALETLGSERFSLILTDLSLPDMSGVDLVQQIRCQSKYLDTPIIAITAHTQEEKIRAARGAGCSEVLTKPYHARRLVDLVKHYLAVPAQQRVKV